RSAPKSTLLPYTTLFRSKINIKSFKIPNKLNQFVYKYFRKSKARRSFEFATILLQKGIGTPAPVAFMENFNGLGLQKSFYASLQDRKSTRLNSSHVKISY